MTVDIGTTSLRLWTKTTPSGLIIATSPDLPGLILMERSHDDLTKACRELAPILIADRAERELP